MKRISSLLTILAFIFAIFAIFPLQADVSVAKRVGYKYVDRLIALDHNKDPKRLQESDGSNGYYVEIERELMGRLAPSAEVKLPYSISASPTIGFSLESSFIASKKVATKAEAKVFRNKNHLNVAIADKFDLWEKGESYKFAISGSLILDPSVEMFGIWTVIKGSWVLGLEKTSISKVKVKLQLVNSQTASFYVDMAWNMISYDIGRQMAKGMAFEIDMDSEAGREAYQQLFLGNMLTAQEYAKIDNGVTLLEESKRLMTFTGTSLFSRSPGIFWYLLTHDFRIEEVESSTKDVVSNKETNMIGANYVDDLRFTLFHFYHAKVRQFEAAKERETEKRIFRDTWDEEFNRGAEGQLPNIISNFKQKTQLYDYLDITVPDQKSAGYTHANFTFDYSEEFINYLLSDRVDFDTMAKTAVSKMVKARLPQTKYYAMGTGPFIAQEIEHDKLRIPKMVQTIELKLNKLKKMSNHDDGAFYKEMAEIMKIVYQDPYLYKEWLDRASKCGSSLSFVIESERFARHQINKKFEIDESCQ